MKSEIELTLNGSAIAEHCEPRTHLADFVRDQARKTGTHLGCEHGSCGACTLLLDGEPIRGCLTLAVSCRGRSVTTIEGLENDEIIVSLRRAFKAEHALQCGYCTPGMLITARDIIQRFQALNDAELKHELAGNLCRCTGYVGIVKAIQRVMGERRGT